VVADVCKEGSVDDVLMKGGALQFGREPAKRPVSGLASRARFGIFLCHPSPTQTHSPQVAACGRKA
jgi:hypothetical protein